MERRVRVAGADIPLIAKIEKPQAAENAEAIIRAALGGIMVARGDLGIELPIERVPTVQKRLLALAGRHSRPSITATQMLASMVTSSRPTRAEVTDVANAIYQGTDAVMLSEETAVGDYPVEAVRVMDRIARETEPDLPYGDWVFSRVATEPSDVAGSVARAAVGSTYTLGLAALVVPTRSGRTARLVSAHRPRVPMLAVSPRIETVRRLQLLFGVHCALAEEWTSLRACSTTAPGSPGRPASPPAGPDRDHRRAAGAGARHEPVRDPPGPVAAYDGRRAAARSRLCHPPAVDLPRPR